MVLSLQGCGLLGIIKKPVKVAPILGPVANATSDQLLAEINRIAAVKSIRGKVDIQFQDTSFAELGLAEKYRTTDGTVTAQRPGQVYLQIQIPVFGTDIAQMTSDGTKFRVAVLLGDQKYRQFVIGTNNAVYKKLKMPDKNTSGDKKKVETDRTVSVLSNLRPQHFTEAVLLNPARLDGSTGYFYSQSEAFEDEKDPRVGASKNARIIRSYYVLDELAPPSNGISRLSRRFWFDRVNHIRLARVQNYDDHGALVTDVVYGDLKPFGEAGIPLPARIELTRPQDRYKISLTYYAPDSVSLNKDYPAEAFVLENKWGLPEVNLDERAVQKSPGQ